MTGKDGKVNATGLTAQESRALPTRQVEDEAESKIIQGIKELYLCKPKESTYEIYADNAVFHDPVSIAEGLPRIRAQFNALPKLFPRSTIDKFDVLESPKTLSPSTKSIVINQDVTYYRSEKTDEKPFKTMNSLVTLIRDNQGKVIKHTEEWNHDNLVDSSNSGFLGTLNEARKKAFAALSMPFVDQTAPEDRK